MRYSMWVDSFSKIYDNVKAEVVWDIWADVNNWSKWHGDLDYCRMEGAFVEGNHFFLKPKGVSEVKIEITEIDEMHKFTDCTKFFGAKMYDTHIIEEVDDQIRLTNQVVVVGPLKWLWVWLVAKNVAKDSESQLDQLVELARKSK